MSDEFKYNLIADIMSKYERAETDRRNSVEDRWSKAYHNYRGQYLKDVHFQEHEKSRVFIKATKTKVLAAHGQAADLIFQGGHLPIAVTKTDVPQDTIKGSMEVDTDSQPLSFPQQTNPYNVGYAGDGAQVPPGAKFGSIQKASPQSMPSMAPAPQEPDFMTPARNMQRLIHDQIQGVRGHVVVSDAMFEACLLGTGIIKGPFNHNKTISRWEEDGILTQEEVKVPKIEFVSCWNFYPDPEATCMDEAEWVIQKHKLSRTQLIALKQQPNFNSEEIDDCLRYSEGNAEDSELDREVQAEEGSVNPESYRWDVYEYWGSINMENLPDELSQRNKGGERVIGDMQINAWVTGGKLIRLILNPFEPSRIPYLVFPYEKNPYSIWGVGVADNMDDMQSMMNGTARMAIDNAALSGNLVFDIDESALAPGEDDTIYPGKKFKRVAGMPGQAIYGIKFPNTSMELMMMFDRWRQLADESTGIPSYSHGNTGVTGMTRTAAGMSMLMGAANLQTKTFVRNIDQFLLEPLGNYYFYWNKQFYEGNLNIEGDLEVKATGTQSLIQKEVKSQRLLTFLQLAGNPAVAPMINIKNVVEDLAFTLDADASRYVNTIDMARQQAEIIGLQNQKIEQQQMAEGTTGNGNGNIGVGQAAQPGEEEFSGNK